MASTPAPATPAFRPGVTVVGLAGFLVVAALTTGLAAVATSPPRPPAARSRSA